MVPATSVLGIILAVPACSRWEKQMRQTDIQKEPQTPTADRAMKQKDTPEGKGQTSRAEVTASKLIHKRISFAMDI